MGFLISVIFWISQAIAARVDLQVDGREVYSGVPFVLSVIAKDFEESPEPTVEAFSIQGCTVEFQNMMPSVSTNMSWSPGRGRQVVRDVEFVFNYVVTAKKSGVISTPPITVRQSQESVTVQPQQLQVRQLASSRDMDLVFTLPSPKVRAGETSSFTLDVFFASKAQNQQISVPLFDLSDRVRIQPDAAGQDETLSIQTAAGPVEFPYSHSNVQHKGRDFSRFRVRGKITFLKSGPLRADGAAMIAQLRSARRGRGRFGFRNSVFRPYQVVDKPIDIMVTALPLKGKPNTFTGAVGESFSIGVRASKTVVKVGEPVTLTIDLRGKGELSGITLPDFDDMGFESKDFDWPKEAPIGLLAENGSKSFEVTVQINHQAVREVPALSFSYYDGKAERYVTAESEPIALSVEGSALINASGVVSSVAQSPETPVSQQSISLSGADLSLSPLGASTVQAWSLRDTFPIALLFYLLPFFAGIVLFYRRRTESSRSDRNELKAAKKALNDAVANAGRQSARDSSGPLCQALRQWAIVSGADSRELIAAIESTAYSPASANSPLPESLLSRCRPTANSKSNSTSGSMLMIFLLVAVGTHVSTVRSAVESDPRQAYETALKLTDRAERIRAFEGAVRGFEMAVEANPQSVELLTDLGNAAIGAADLGIASLSFRRALSIDPGHERARRNLSWVEQQLPEWSRMASDQSPLAGLLFWSSWLNGGALLLFSGIVFCLFGLSVLFFWRKNRIVVGLLGVFWLSIAGSLVAESMASKMAVVQAEAGPIRAADSHGAPPVTTEWMPSGAAVILLRQTDQWSEVSTKNGLRGWLPNRALESVEN